MRGKRLEAHLLRLLREPRSLEELHALLKPSYPGLSKASLFALLVRLRREGRLLYQEGRFFLPGEEEKADA
ncbi:hypothetical protein [Thermus sediminis]|uniref:hypothetical protein n=1 Tax=Thermus sediminis TaxID=1761908 RepID=UPI000E3D12BF|nr:hypothetical protein [Thermus sediminis]